MAAKKATADAEEHDYDPFAISPESRLMMRSLPYFHLPGFEPLPNVAGARAKVDCLNTNYQRPRPKSADGSRRGRGTKTNYSRVTSKVDTGRGKSGGRAERPKSATITDPLSFEALTSARRKLSEMRKSMTLPRTNRSTPRGLDSRRKCASLPRGIKISTSAASGTPKSQTRARVDCSNPLPVVTNQLHSLEELQIISDLGKEKLNPRFQHRTTRRAQSCDKPSRKFSLPADFEKSTTSRTVDSVTPETRQRRVTVHSTSTSKTSKQVCPTVPDRKALKGESSPIVSGSKASTQRDSSTASETISGSAATVPHPHRVTGQGKKMEVLRQAPTALENRSHDDGDVVKTKPFLPGTQSRYENGNFQAQYPSQVHIGSGVIRTVSHETGDYQTARDSVSSSESVGVNPEYCSMELDTDAFSVDAKQERHERDGGEWGLSEKSASNRIVGFEVSTNASQTTVNLLHLLGRKNKSVEQTQSDYQNHELWVIGEEQEEESEDDEEMEDELYLSDGASSGVPETIFLNTQPVPQLFIVDENNTVVEKVKTGRRRQSRGAPVGDLYPQPPPPPSSPDLDQLHFNSLSLNDDSCKS